MNLQESIKALLQEQECVVIPDFGGFVTNYKPAFIHPKTEYVQPPSKQVTFNVNLTNNDGLVANYISIKEGVDYATALDYVKQTVGQFHATLEETKRLEIAGLGILSRAKQGHLEFTPTHTDNFLRSSFGLKPIFLPLLTELAPEQKVEEETVIATPEINPEKETPVVPITTQVEKREKRRVSRKWIAAAALMPLMYFGGVKLQQNSHHISSFWSGMFGQKNHVVESEFTPRFEGEHIAFSYNEVKSELEAITTQNPELQSVYYSFNKAEISPDGLKVVLNTDASKGVYNTSKTSSLELYFIVAGCFKEKTNADGLVKKLRKKGHDAGIFGKKGNLHMVCYGSFTNKSAAKKELVSIKASENPGAWLKKH